MNPPSDITPAKPSQSAAKPVLPRIQGPKLPFVDEGAADPSFSAYRARLLEAVRSRDIQTVLQLSDPSVRTSFGDSGGRADLSARLQQHPELWSEMDAILSLGGTFRGEGAQRMFWAPYVYSTFPDSADAFTTLAVIADDVPLRTEPSKSAAAIALLSRDLVTADAAPRTEWTEVKTADGRHGFVESRSLRSPVGYRAGFAKSGQTWKMTALVAGD